MKHGGYKPMKLPERQPRQYFDCHYCGAKHLKLDFQKQFDDGIIQYWHPTEGPGLFRITVAPSGITVDMKQGQVPKRTFQMIGSCLSLADAQSYLVHMQGCHVERKGES